MLLVNRIARSSQLLVVAVLFWPITSLADEDRGTWTGKVIDEKWQPVHDADIRLKWMRNVAEGKTKLLHGSRVRSGADGTYQIIVPEKLQGDDSVVLNVRFSKSGYLTRDAKPVSVPDLFGEKGSSVGARSARRELRQVRIRRGRVIKGQVRLPNGTVAAGAEVVVSSKPGAYDWKFPDPNRYYATSVAIANENGFYEVIGDVRATMRVRLASHAEYSIALLSECSQNDPQPLIHNVRLPRSVRPHGTITDENGNAVSQAIVRYRRLAMPDDSEGSTAMGLLRFSVADNEGRYELPPVTAGTYEVTVGSRLADASKRDEVIAGRFGSRRDLYARLGTVIPAETVKLEPEDDVPQVNLEGVPTCRVRIAITEDDPPATLHKRAPLIPITGRFMGKRWSGYSLPTAVNKSADFLVPQGVEHVKIQFSYALVKYPGDKEFRNGTSIDIDRVDNDVGGYAIHLTSLSRLEAKILLSDELRVSKVGILSVFLTTCPETGPSVGRQFGRLHVGGNTTKFNATLPPNVRYWLHVETGKRSLHREEIVLKPHEVRPLKIDLREKK